MRVKGQDNFISFASLAGCSILEKETLVKNKSHNLEKPIDLFIPVPTDTSDVFLQNFCKT